MNEITMPWGIKVNVNPVEEDEFILQETRECVDRYEDALRQDWIAKGYIKGYEVCWYDVDGEPHFGPGEATYWARMAK